MCREAVRDHDCLAHRALSLHGATRPTRLSRLSTRPTVTAVSSSQEIVIGSADPAGEVDLEIALVTPAVERLERAFGQPFFLFDTATETVHCSGSKCLGIDVHARLTLCDQIARRGRAEIIEDFSPLLALAAPLIVGEEPTTLVAIATFLTQEVHSEEEIAQAAHIMGVDGSVAFRWAQKQEVWNPRAVIELSRAICANATQAVALEAQKTQLADVSSHLLSTFEELSMLHRLTERLSIASSEVELGELAIQWLADVIPAECFAAVLCLEPEKQDKTLKPQHHDQAEALTFGSCPIEHSEFGRFIDRLGPEVNSRCLVLNRDATQSPTWCYPEVRELISVPIRSSEKGLGWVLAFNHTGGGRREREFGAVEASLVSSVAAILGVHTGNCRLYREQKDFLATMVRALSSAIDAKDPYTSGHSDRVARMAVCLSKQTRTRLG